MATKDIKTFEKFRHELKQFFKAGKGVVGNSVKEEHSFAIDIEKDLSSQSHISHRIKMIQEFSDVVLYNQLEDGSIEKICHSIEDILSNENSIKEHRHIVFSFFKCLVQGQYERLGLVRRYFFQLIVAHVNKEDFVAKFELFQSLTENGKDILYFENEIPLLLEWMPLAMENGKALDFLHILVNVVKYNTSYIMDDTIGGLIHSISYVCIHSDTQDIVLCSLEVLDAIVCYCNLTHDTLPVFIAALCRTINLELYSSASWKIMRNLLGTHMGHLTLCTMCTMLQDNSFYDDIGLIRGIIFVINTALWSNKSLLNLRYTPSCVLPCFEKPAQCNNPIILFEITSSMKLLINKIGDKLHYHMWDNVFVILQHILKYIEQFDDAPCKVLFHSILDKLEALIEIDHFDGDEDTFFTILDRCSSNRPESSIVRFMNHQINKTSIDTNWSENMTFLLNRFYINDTRINIRTRALELFATCFSLYRLDHEQKLLEVALQFFSNITSEEQIVVQNSVAKLLITLTLECNPHYMGMILDIFEKILRKPFESVTDGRPLIENECGYLKIIVPGLIDIFFISVYKSPSSNAVRILSILVSFLKSHYSQPQVFDSVPTLRVSIIECILKLKSDNRCRLGCMKHPERLPFSPYLIIDQRRLSNISMTTVSPARNKLGTRSPINSFDEDLFFTEITFISLSGACAVIVTALKRELDWNVLSLILKLIPEALKNKAITLTKDNNDVEQLAIALCNMITDKSSNLPDVLRNTPQKFTTSEFHSHVFPVLATFASYHVQLEPLLQQRLIKCLEVGLVSRSAPQCVSALTICILEMHDTMVKLLPEVLLNLSKISATVHIANPILEFLSMLATFPKVFSNFVPDQYMSVFAVSLPYTNPFKYTHYIVSLAHHVIAVWFLRCRRTLRRDFVKFIISGLKENALAPFAEGYAMRKETSNEDSSNRKRSSSLTEQSSKRKEGLISVSSRTGICRGVLEKSSWYESLMLFHRELTETCIDLMSRYTFSTCSPVPKRHPSSEFIFQQGHRMTWLLGTKLVTITTSGCTQKPIRNGLCDHCFHNCILNKVDIVNTAGGSSEVKNMVIDLLDPSALENSSSSTVECVDVEKKVSSENVDHCISMFTHIQEEVLRDQVCSCWCQGWAEIRIRRPTGDVSWVMRLQNELNSLNNFDNLLSDMSTLNLSSTLVNGIQADSASLSETSPVVVKHSKYPSNTIRSEETDNRHDIYDLQRTLSDPVSIPSSPVRHSLLKKDYLDFNVEYNSDEDEYYGYARNPVRRSNSSPEMSSSWKNPFLKDASVIDLNASDLYCEPKKPVKNYSKEMRGNCEAIPEEISGSTPPGNENVANSSGMNTANSDSNKALNSTALSSHSKADKELILPDPTSNSSNELVPNLNRLKGSRLRRDKSVQGDSSHSILRRVSSHSSENVCKKPNKIYDKCTINQDEFSKFEFERPSGSVVCYTKSSLATFSAGSSSHTLTPNNQSVLASKPPPLPPSSFSPRSYSRMESRSDTFGQHNQDYRPRGNTISVMSPMKRPSLEWDVAKQQKVLSATPRNRDVPRSGVNPSFVFLQLYHSAHFGISHEKPVLITPSDVIHRALNVFDLIPPYETHRVGVIYVGPNQANSETEILRNQSGSVRYISFLRRLGTLIRLDDADPQNMFLGGLERNGNDGKFAYIWKDDVMQVIFHVATLMPNKENDTHCSNKKRHIGNDYVTIVYNESGLEYDLHTVKCQFNFACVIIEPLQHDCNQVTVKAREDLLEHIGNIQPKIVSDTNVSLLARQLALHINLASRVLCSLNERKGGTGTYASNWLERLRKIKQIRSKVLENTNDAYNTPGVNPNSHLPVPIPNTSSEPSVVTSSKRKISAYDFTEYT